MSSKIRPEDVVVALLAQVRHETGLDRFEANPVHVHPPFFDWRSQARYAELFNTFIFDTKDYFPYSETLDSVLDGLQLAGYLERTNPRGTWYQITPALMRLFESDIKKKFKEQQLHAFEDLARDFVKTIKTDPRKEASPKQPAATAP